MAVFRPFHTVLCSGARRSIRVGALVSSVLVFAAGVVSAQIIQINEERAQISHLIKKVGEATGNTILFDDSVRGTISIVAKRAVSHDEAWSILDASLSILGFSLLPSTAGMWRIAKVAEAVGESPFVSSVDDESHAFVTSLIPLRVADPAEVLAVLEPLSGASVTIISLESSRSLIASGPERRIARLTTIADSLDRVDERKIRTRLLRYRDVSQVESWLESLFESAALSRRDLAVWTDERTNGLIYRGTDTEMSRLEGFIDRFDLPIEGEGRLQVVHVLNRDAEEVATLLRQFGEDSGTTPSPGLPGQSLTRLQQSDFSIAVDPKTRSLIVRGDVTSQAAVRETLEILDQAPQLIALDLIITEVRTPSSFSLGFGFSIPLTAGDDPGEIIGRLVSNPGGAGFTATPSADTTFVGRVDQDLNIPFIVDDATGISVPIANTGVITAGDVKIRTEILMEPSLVLTAGDSHEIFVGTNVPVPVAADSGTQLSENAVTGSEVLSQTTNIERRDTGIKVIVDARAGKIGPIELDLDVEISRLIPSVAGPVELVGPTFAEQHVIATARLKDGAFAMIALSHDTRSVDLVSGTPFLSSIPFLGRFFTDTKEQSEDTHLFLAARAKRVGSPGELIARTTRKRLAFERRDARESAMPRVEEGAPAYAVLVTTRTREDDARSIADGLSREGYAAEVYTWTLRGKEVFDVYVRDLETMTKAAAVASELAEAGWEADLTLLPTRS